MPVKANEYSWHWWDYLLSIIAGGFIFLAVILWNPLWLLGWLTCLFLDAAIMFLVLWFDRGQ
jgi:hypothetical protein